MVSTTRSTGAAAIDMLVAVGDDDAALGAAGQRRDRDVAAHRCSGRVEVARSRRASRSRPRWRTGCRHRPSTSSRKAARWRPTQNGSESDERDLAAGGVGDRRRLAERLPAPRRVEEIAFEIGDLGGADQSRDRCRPGPARRRRRDRSPIVRWPSGVTRTGSARCRARCRRRRVEADADRGDVVAEHLRPTGRRAPCRYRRRVPPSEAIPAIVLPAEPPELSIAGPILR